MEDKIVTTGEFTMEDQTIQVVFNVMIAQLLQEFLENMGCDTCALCSAKMNTECDKRYRGGVGPCVEAANAIRLALKDKGFDEEF